MSMDSMNFTGRPEAAPSGTAAEVPAASRVLGAVGLLLAVLGTASVIAAGYGRGILPVGAGYFAAVLGTAAMLIHALRDGEIEMRRLYGALAVVLVVLALGAGLYPGEGDSGKVYGKYLLPWGIGLGFVGMLFFSAFLRHETIDPIRRYAQYFALIVGVLLMVGSAVGGLIVPDFLVAKGLLLSLLGLGFVCIYLNVVDTSEGFGYRAVMGLGILGAVALALAVGRAIAPSVLYDGPSAIRTPLLTIDLWKVVARVFSILLCFGVMSLGLVKSLPVWFRTTAVVAGLAVAAVFVTGTIAKAMVNPPLPYLVPHGLILGGLGLIYLTVSTGILSESSFVVLARREFSAYFYSPIAYFVIIGMTFMGMVSFGFYLSELAAQPNIPEPIVSFYPAFTLVGAIVVIFIVPVLTMRLFSEERRTGTYEVLLTAPVQEWVVVLSKFFSCWLFFLLCWIPVGLFLLALALVGPVFDYRPVLSFYLTLACTGAGFIAMGTFFSSLTKNQIIAAVLTGAVMFFYLLTIIVRIVPFLGEGVKAALSKLSFLTLWQSSLNGELAVQTILVHLSLAVFWLFLTVKVLEIRKWS